NIDCEYKDLYVSKFDKLFSDITEIKSYSWEYIIKHRKVSLIIENIISYFIKSDLTIDKTLTEFINSGEITEINMNTLKGNFDDEDLDKFFDKVLSVNEIHNDTYSKLIKYAKVVNEVKKVSKLDEDKLILLLNENLLLMHVDMLKHFRNKFSDLILKYVECDPRTYVDILKGDPSLRIDGELKSILKSQSIDIKELKILFDMLEKKGSEDLLSYPTDLQKFIIEKHPNCIDIHLILNHYYDFDISMQEKIKKYFM